MWRAPLYYGTDYWYALLFCEKCKRFTTHRTESPQTSGTFDLSRMDWKCVECIDKEEKPTELKYEKCGAALDSYHPCPHCGYAGGPL